ncbi:MAG: CBS domain-containing protein [Myxococcota bacterium]
MHTLRHVIHRLNLIHATPEMSVLDVATVMSEGRVGAIAVLDHGHLVGIFTERDLMTRVVVAGRDPATTCVEDVMTHEVVTAGLDDTVERSIDKMRSNGCRHLPVIHTGRVVTMLSMRHLLRDEVEEQVEEIRTLRATLTHTMPS